MSRKKSFLCFFGLLLVSVACGRASLPSSPMTTMPAGRDTVVVTQPVLPSRAVASSTITPSAAPTDPPTPTPDTRLPPERWQEWPVIPTPSDYMRVVYQRGLAAGRDATHFSKIGDCQNVDTYFLSVFDRPGEYSLGAQYAYLQPTIDHFRGSWSRKSQAVRGGMNVASVLSPLWADPQQCEKGETPLACEIRLHNPSIVIISMETWWGQKPAETYEAYLRQVVEYILAQNIVPILATKADNLEGDHSINAAIARVAYDYDLPLWNFWAAVQPLPNHGLSPDGFHLTFARNFFDDPVRMQNAWPWRNLTALQTLDTVWRTLRRP